MSIKITTLPSGLRVITDSVLTVESVAVGIWCDVGTRHENMEHNGVAHMVEHMMFNGTKSRSAKDIVEQIEYVGGQMNAYTSRENTAYYIHLLKDDLSLALNVLADMIQNSIFPDQEMEKEREVILQEIGMVNDTPDDLVFDIYQETAYPGQTIGAPILGRSEIIETIQKTILFDYVHTFYNPANLVISVAGNCQHEQVVQMAQEFFIHLPTAQKSRFQPARYCGGEARLTKDLEQVHIVLGFLGVGKYDSDYHAANLLSTILGGGMSSRLFQEIREKHGLVYSVYSSHTAYSEEGQFEIYAGTGEDKVSKLIPVLSDEIHKITQSFVTEEELKRAKAQITSSILMGRESMLSRASRQARYLINYNAAFDLDSMMTKIQAVEISHIHDAAQKIFSTRPTIVALGPNEGLESYDKIQNRLAA